MSLVNVLDIRRDIPVPRRAKQTSEEWRAFIKAIKRLQPGESFTVPHVGSNHRLAMGVAQEWLEATYTVRREGTGYRIWRLT